MFVDRFSQLIAAFTAQPRTFLRLLRRIPLVIRALEAANQGQPDKGSKLLQLVVENPLASYFNAHTHGKGIWKWLHYFEAYHRHFQKFVGHEVHVLEIGIYSGGSLDMWRNYFGSKSRLYGVDIQPACKAHENEYTKVFIGDQADRNFWREFKRQVPAVDILIDDGGHIPEQQMVTLEEMLPHLRPGGIYFCEDIQGRFNDFNSFVAGLLASLNSCLPANADSGVPPTGFQSQVHSIHCYPFATVIEKRQPPIAPFRAPKQGSEWGTWL
jgi:hypothetical protein